MQVKIPKRVIVKNTGMKSVFFELHRKKKRLTFKEYHVMLKRQISHRRRMQQIGFKRFRERLRRYWRENFETSCEPEAIAPQ
jgi:hypothetical protein